jgi:hypothetical protein
MIMCSHWTSFPTINFSEHSLHLPSLIWETKSRTFELPFLRFLELLLFGYHEGRRAQRLRSDRVGLRSLLRRGRSYPASSFQLFSSILDSMRLLRAIQNFITHYNPIASVGAVNVLLDFLVYLPLAHVPEYIVELVIIIHWHVPALLLKSTRGVQSRKPFSTVLSRFLRSSQMARFVESESCLLEANCVLHSRDTQEFLTTALVTVIQGSVNLYLSLTSKPSSCSDRLPNDSCAIPLDTNLSVFKSLPPKSSNYST